MLTVHTSRIQPHIYVRCRFGIIIPGDFVSEEVTWMFQDT